MHIRASGAKKLPTLAAPQSMSSTTTSTDKRPAFEFTDDDPAPQYIKALVEPSYSWTGYFGEEASVRYSFLERPDDFEILKENQPTYVDVSAGFSPIGDDKNIFLSALRFFEATANIHFIEDNQKYNVGIYKFKQVDMKKHPFYVDGYGNITGVAGFATYFFYSNGATRVIGFNSDEFSKPGNLENNIETETHEGLHGMVGLKHPFGGAFALTATKQKYTTFSIMNYDREKLFNWFTLVPLTPMPPDMEAAQFMYGINPNTNKDDTVYNLNHIIPSTSNFLNWLSIIPVVSLSWDNGGIDTLDAHEIKSDSIIDMNPYGRSRIKNGILMMPNIQIENVIGGIGRNKILLNSLDNIVDLRASRKSSTLIIDPTNCGKDTVVGFNLIKDKIIIRTTSGTPQWNITTTSPSQVILNGETITLDSSVKIAFDDKNSVEISNIPPVYMNSIDIAVKTDPEINALLWDLFKHLPEELFEDFYQAFLQGAMVTFALCLTDEILKKYGCSDRQIAAVNMVVQCLLIFLTGTFLSSTAGFATNSLLRYLGCSDQTAQRAGTVTAKLVETTLTVESPLHLFNVAASTIGSYSGCRLTLWTKNKAVDMYQRFNRTDDKATCYHARRFLLWAKEKTSSLLHRNKDALRDHPEDEQRLLNNDYDDEEALLPRRNYGTTATGL